MNVNEFDFRYDWTSVILDALESGFKIVQQKADAEPWLDGLWQMEHAEGVLGIAFIVAQAYILGTVEDLNRIRESEKKSSVSKIDIYSDVPQLLSNNVSSILLINSIANYYKHHDEWDSWPTNLTGEVLGNVGIRKGTEFPCHVAAAKLWGENEIGNLKTLLEIISKWREYILAKYK
jgi:hypothetical protein